MSALWDAPFETTLREALPLLPADAPLEGETCLSALGLDSMATIETLLRLEERYEVTFPDEALTSATFSTPASLWGVLTGLRADTA